MTTQIGNFKIEFWDTIDALPYDQFTAFNKYVMLDAELGATVQDFDQKTAKIHRFLASGMIKEGRQALMNLRNVVHNILTETNTRGLAFACLIKKVNGKNLESYDSDHLKELLSKLSKAGLSGAIVYDTTADLKKNLKPN